MLWGAVSKAGATESMAVVSTKATEVIAMHSSKSRKDEKCKRSGQTMVV